MNYKIKFQSNEGLFIEDDHLKLVGRKKRDASFLKVVVKGFYEKSSNNNLDFTGSWWFCLLDKSSNKLWLKRDKHSYTSVFYTRIEDTLFVSEDLDYLLKLKEVKINCRKIASLMVSFDNDFGRETVFNGIYSLPAGNELIIDNGVSKVSRYWFPENIAQLKFKRSEDYSEKLRDILISSVNQHIGDYTNVASMLSGGLDSSSVTCLAAEHLAKKGKMLNTFTHFPKYVSGFRNRPNSFGDESAHAKLVIEKYNNIKGNFLNSSSITPIAALKKWVDLTNGIVHGACNVFWMYDLFKTVGDSKFDLLLTGENGNGTVSFLGIRAKLPWSHKYYRQNILIGVKDKIYQPSKIIIKRLLGTSDNGSWNINSNFLNSNVIHDLDLKEAFLFEKVSIGTVLDTPKNLMNLIIEQARNGRMPLGGLVSKKFGFEMADPTGSPELIEFCYSLPNEVFFGKEGLSRNLIREIMKGILPDSVRLETKKGHQSADIGARLKDTSIEVEEALSTLSKNKTFEYLFDINALKKFWEMVKHKDSNSADQVTINAFLKTIMAGFLIEKFS